MKTITYTIEEATKALERKVRETKAYGHTYVPVNLRAMATGLGYYVGAFGRSLVSGGHKYKVSRISK